MNNWGLTLPFLARPPSEDGNHLPHPRTFLMWHCATAFVQYLYEPQVTLILSRHHLQAWTGGHGVMLDLRFLPWLWSGAIIFCLEWDPFRGRLVPF